MVERIWYKKNVAYAKLWCFAAEKLGKTGARENRVLCQVFSPYMLFPLVNECVFVFVWMFKYRCVCIRFCVCVRTSGIRKMNFLPRSRVPGKGLPAMFYAEELMDIYWLLYTLRVRVIYERNTRGGLVTWVVYVLRMLLSIFCLKILFCLFRTYIIGFLIIYNHIYFSIV